MKKLGLLFVCALMWTTLTAQTVYQYVAVMNLNFATDSSGYPPDCTWVSMWDFTAAQGDIARYLDKDSIEIVWPAFYTNDAGTAVRDSTIALVKILAAGMTDSVGPQGMIHWVDANGFRTSEPLQFGPPHVVAHSFGSIAGAGGLGAYHDTIRVVDTSQAPDDTLTNFVFVIKDFSGTLKTPSGSNTGTTNAGSVVKLDNENLTFAAQGNWYFQEAGVDSVTLPAADTFITIKVYKFAVSVPSGSDSITLVVNLPSQEYSVKVTPLLQGQGQMDTAGTMVDPDPVYGKPDGNNIAQVIVLRSSACSPTMPYEILVYHKDDKDQLARVAEYITPSDTNSVVILFDDE